jgi:TonB family protein
MIAQNRKYSGILTFLAVSLLLSISFVFSTSAQESTENTFGYSQEQIDKAPSVIERILPVYPYSAKMLRIPARVKLRFLVGIDGLATEIEVLEVDPEDAIDVFGPPAVDAIKEWRFSPGEIGGEPVPTRAALNLFFELDSQSDEVTP